MQANLTSIRDRIGKSAFVAGLFTVLVLAIFYGTSARAAEESLESKEAPAAEESEPELAVVGPNLGRILGEIHPPAELFVTEDRKVQITFLLEEVDESSALGDPVISAYCGKRTAPTRMSFERDENVFLSDKQLPPGNNIPTVLQFTMTPDSEKKTLRLNLNLAMCPGCDLPEYACTCDHGDGHDHGEEEHSHDGHDHGPGGHDHK